MSYENVSINERPNHFMILDAIAKGMANINKITKVTKLNEVKIELIINDLFNQRLVVKSETKGFLGRRKKTEIRITEPGLRLLNTKKQELEQKSEQIQGWYNSVDRSRLESFMDSNRTWIPMMLFSGIMDTMFFMSMMYLMGIAMNPHESAMVGEGRGEGHSNNSQEIHSVADNSNNSHNTSNEQQDYASDGVDYNNVVRDSSGFAGFDGGVGGIGFDNL